MRTDEFDKKIFRNFIQPDSQRFWINYRWNVNPESETKHDGRPDGDCVRENRKRGRKRDREILETMYQEIHVSSAEQHE